MNMEWLLRPEALDMAMKVASAWVAGSLIGLERTYHGRPAGFRTHALVCTSSALLMLVTSYQWEWVGGAPMDTIRTDPTRMAQGIMTGIGFLGAGVIFKEGLTVRGLTTAASIWTTAAIGVLFGTGMYFPALLGSLLTLGILSAFRRMEVWIPTQFYAHYAVRYLKDTTPPESDVRRTLSEHGFKMANMSYALLEDGAIFEYRTVIKTAKKTDAERLAAFLRAEPHVRGFTIAPTGD